MKKNQELNSGVFNILVMGLEEALAFERHKAQGTIVEVNMRNYRWAKDRWPGRTVHCVEYETHNTMTIRKPGYLFERKPKRVRRIRIDDETLKRETERTNLTTTYPKLVPKRGS